MLDRFTVKSFKSLVDVSVDLGTVNVFIGSNGSGKSNLLEALGVLGAAASGRVNDESLKYRGVRPGLPALYKSSFKNIPGARYIRFEATGFGCSYAVSLWNPNEEPATDWTFMNELLMSGTKKVAGRSTASSNLNPTAGLAALKLVEIFADDPAVKLMDALQTYAIYAPNTPTLRGLEPDPQSRTPVGLAGGKLLEGVRGIGGPVLKDVLQLVGWIQDIGVRDTSRLPISESVPQPQKGLLFRDRFMLEGRNILSGYDASEGVLYLIFCSVLALHPSAPKVFAIDNFDQALNPRIARAFTLQFCDWLLDRQYRQVLLTTHNPIVLDGLPLRDDRVRLFAVDRSKSGQTVVNRVEVNDSMLNSAEKGIPLSQQWVMGNFGGVPSGV